MATTKKINPVNANLPAPATSPKDELTSSVPYQSPVAAPAPKAPAPASKTHRTIESYPNGTYQITTYDEANNPVGTSEILTEKQYQDSQQTLGREAGIAQFNRELPATSEEKVADVNAKQ